VAVEWLKWMKGLSRRPEVLGIAAALGLDRRIVATACMELWEWADDNTTTGRIRGVGARDVDDFLQLPGFANAMSAQGWLRVCADGITFVRWERNNGRSAKARALAALRQSRRRKNLSRSQRTARHAVSRKTNERLCKMRKKNLSASRNGAHASAGQVPAAQGSCGESARHADSVTRKEKKRIDTLKSISSAHSQQALELYALYPRKVAKASALAAIGKALQRAPFETLREAVAAYAAARAGSDPQFTPYPATWFNQERWLDDRASWQDGRPGDKAAGTRVRNDTAGDYAAVRNRASEGDGGAGV
jgi:hypothetical protein